LQCILSGNATHVTHALSDYKNVKSEREDMLTEVRGHSDKQYKLVKSAKKQQQGKGNDPILRQHDDDRLEEVNGIAGQLSNMDRRYYKAKTAYEDTLRTQQAEQDRNTRYHQLAADAKVSFH
jgi:uncharacterized protein HemY